MKMSESLYDYLNRVYPRIKDQKKQASTKLQNMMYERHCNCQLKDWHDFAIFLKDYQELNNPEINMMKNSIWAVVKEFLGELSDDDQWISIQCGGIWTVDDKNGVHKTVTVRQILTDLTVRYPIK